MSTSNAPEELGQVLVDFSTNGTFPENESISAAHVDNSILPAALAALQNAKEELEASYSVPRMRFMMWRG
jgi:centromere/kinetochore protein ZW10